MSNAQQLIMRLLDYIEQVEKLKAKPAFAVPELPFSAFQHELQGLPELQLNQVQEGEDLWLRFPRIQEIAPPPPGECLEPWIQLSRTSEKRPELRNEAVMMDGKRVLSREALADHPEIRGYFDWYLKNQWLPWAEAERPRRKAISQYTKLFSVHEAIASDGAETPLELVWGMGVVSWKKPGVATSVRYPLIIQPCEISLNTKTLDLEVRPRDVEPRLEMDCYAAMELPGVPQLEAYWKSWLTSIETQPNPFEQASFEAVVKTAVGHLDPSGSYDDRADDASVPTPSDSLKARPTWVLFARKRSGDIFLEDVRRLKKAVADGANLPAVVRSFVEHGDSEIRVRPEVPFRGLSSSDGVSGARELYFPMPYNDEQVSIIQKLEINDGVVVQGPPGTGKTHTIANVICHYLAQGKRVLVTAKSESALAVLQEKLPDAIRPLSVALLSDERDGMKQFEHSIQTIASSVASLNVARTAVKLDGMEIELNQLHAKISHVDRRIAEYAERHMRQYEFLGRQLPPDELAKLVVEQTPEHEWFDDVLPDASGDMPISEEDISVLRQARLAVGEDIDHLTWSLPLIDCLPSAQELLNLHRDLVRARALDEQVVESEFPAFVDEAPETIALAHRLAEFLLERTVLKRNLAATGHDWVAILEQRLAIMASDDPLLVALLDVCERVGELDTGRRELLAAAVNVPGDAGDSQDYGAALSRLVNGKTPFSLPFGKTAAKALLASTNVLGHSPKGVDEWQLVERCLQWRVDAKTALARWQALAPEFGLRSPPSALDEAVKTVAKWQPIVKDVRRLVFECDTELEPMIQNVFGKRTSSRFVTERESFLQDMHEGIDAHVAYRRLAHAQEHEKHLGALLEGYAAPVVGELQEVLSEALGDADTDEGELQVTWKALSGRLAQLVNLRPAFDDIVRLTGVIESAGAPKWSHRLRTLGTIAGDESQLPQNWREAWHWRQASQLLQRIDEHDRLRRWFVERKDLTMTLARTYQDLIAGKTWLGVYNNSPDFVRQALQSYLTAIHAMGAGTGVRAIRHRRTARLAMERAYKAVPCWVLPQWRVSETIPAEIGLFDLVVIDEASQSDIWALPALLRGKKLLVVGDHKQVSPSAVGLADARITDLIRRFLEEQPHGRHMTPEQSIYDLARVVFAGNSVMLKEHFRCVPAIIEYSNREFYEGDIRPLRLPKANERLDPPLIDVFVKGGFRDGDVNKAEAMAIVDEIVCILADKKTTGRSIGVVTLHGTQQAAYIHELVSTRIPTADIIERRIAVGPPTVFQGRERDIMLVSMVLDQKSRAAQNRAEMFQRFNVALSRARDRMYLFRSVTDTTFGEDTLNSRLIRHFRQPFSQDPHTAEVLRERCESGFERDVFDEISRRGFRVEPQVPCGGYRIDLVVEGREGRRLAIECDGDRFHGPGQWADDMARQRVLERAGWTFWRCFASSFARRREAVLDDLSQTLDGLGIEPIADEGVDTSAWVHFKEVDPFGVDVGEKDQEEAEDEVRGDSDTQMEVSA